jgi:O-glycosyl hydrolase
MKPLCLLLVHAALLGSAAASDSGERWEISTRQGAAPIWGRSGELPRVFFGELLPALFTRTLTVDQPVPAGSALEWIFTGDQGGITIRIEAQSVRIVQRYYDSYGLSDSHPPKARYPQGIWEQADIPFSSRLHTVTVSLDHKLGLHVELNGKHILRQTCLLEVRRHQLLWTPASADTVASVSGSLSKPPVRRLEVSVDTRRRHQSIYGFGGILSAPAYAMLSPAGRERWWGYIRDYNLLLHREYPNGNRLRPDLSNFDTPADASPHYYGDNFPNGEITDFDYIRQIRALGGHVLFEFWQLPPWARRVYRGRESKTTPNAPILDEYVRAMVGYCRVLQEKTGAAPEVVGIQNEIVQPAEIWQQMILALRRGLDRAGFQSTRIHMPDNGKLAGGIKTAAAIRASAEAWKAVDFAATHVYDFQSYFEDPDGYDPRIADWNRETKGKPFLSTEFTVNDSKYQANTYRVAFAMAQLYHKNMALMDASALVYCWTLLDVEQPSFAATRSLFAVNRADGMVPVASSYQLRAFGAFSRRLRQGMVRVHSETPSPDLLTTAYESADGKRTVILINRSLTPMVVRVNWPGAGFRELETAGPYHPNTAIEASAQPFTMQPGEIATLTNVPLGATKLAPLGNHN